MPDGMEFFEGSEAAVGEKVLLDPSPEPLDGVTFGRVSRKRERGDTLPLFALQIAFDGLGTVDGRTIPDHQQLAGDVLSEIL